MTTLTARGFLFDMDGTLVDSTAVVEAVWAELAAQYGLDLAELHAFGHGRQSRTTIHHFLADRGADVAAAALRFVDTEEETRLDGVVEIPGAAALLGALREQGAPVALVTSASLPLALARMGAAGVPMPDVIVTAERVEHSKPHPDGYLLGASLLGLAAEDCVGFEDADAGVAAVRSAGAQLVVVGETNLRSTVDAPRVADLSRVRVTAGEAPGTYTLSV
ncbi:HAD-IA family hydrolase [Microbacterium nymphoidis]|jgi:mannitol-1-/sugar-/sorbitol-6-phosphatase|uniref:HAD-IA family hydrolase n=1 Tax=Microbacterium nymphoidis TaxID=2898586 RepID=UPI001E32CA91|nr:HAD-IA family hydrolase [Microbacterium nymphoidis]MCD2497542.1 HAD-IA family hydrolase [Microbacterium nymphoidis]